jgi:hypothetical protein
MFLVVGKYSFVQPGCDGDFSIKKNAWRESSDSRAWWISALDIYKQITCNKTHIAWFIDQLLKIFFKKRKANVNQNF